MTDHPMTADDLRVIANAVEAVDQNEALGGHDVLGRIEVYRPEGEDVVGWVQRFDPNSPDMGWGFVSRGSDERAARGYGEAGAG